MKRSQLSLDEFQFVQDELAKASTETVRDRVASELLWLGSEGIELYLTAQKQMEKLLAEGH